MTPDRALAEANVRAAEAWVTQSKVALDVARRSLRAAVEREIRALPPIAHATDYAGIVASLTAALGDPSDKANMATTWRLDHGGVLDVIDWPDREPQVEVSVESEAGNVQYERWSVGASLDVVFKDALSALAKCGVFVEVRS